VKIIAKPQRILKAFGRIWKLETIFENRGTGNRPASEALLKTEEDKEEKVAC
jgi:hypothetical protein